MSKFGIFLASLILLGVLILFCVWVDLAAYARKKRVIKPVEFFAPEGFSPIDVALVYSARRVNANALLTPVLLYWSHQGYVTVEEDGRGLKITKKKCLPPFSESGRVNEKTYGCEQALFSEMFVSGDTFYTLAAGKSINQKYDETVGECVKLSRSVIGEKGKRLSLAMKAAAAVIVFLIGILISVHEDMPVALLMLFPVIGSFLIKFMPAPFFIRVPFLLVWGGVPLLTSLVLMPLPQEFRIVIAAAVVTLLLTICLFAEKADFRGEEELKVYGKVCSFKRFLIVADKHRLEALVEDYHDYFYDILPFCYVFGITKKMKQKFDRVIPDGTFRMLGPIRDVYID